MERKINRTIKSYTYTISVYAQHIFGTYDFTQTNAVNNMKQRVSMIVSIINEKLELNTESKQFILEQESKQHIIDRVHIAIGKWKGIQINNCKTAKNNFDEYLLSARNWFDRSKSKIYGNHLFYPLIFEQIYTFVLKNDCDKGMELFLDMLKDILSSTIKFKGTQCLPLIPLQTFTQPNSFRNACSDLCKHYAVDWDYSSKTHGSTRNNVKSKIICDAFVCKLDEIKHKLESQQSLPTFVDGQNLRSDTNQNVLHVEQTFDDQKVETTNTGNALNGMNAQIVMLCVRRVELNRDGTFNILLEPVDELNGNLPIEFYVHK